MIGINFESHFTWSERIPITPFSVGSLRLKLGIASTGIIFNFGNFLYRANSAMLINVAKSLTIIAFIQSEEAAKTALSYFLSQEIVS